MHVNRTFRELFDNVTSKDFDFYTGKGPWNIHECDKSAKLTDLEVSGKDILFVSFNQELTKNMPCLTSKRSRKFKDYECDGIAFIETKEKEELLFVELKSKYDYTPIIKAVKQMCVSFLKMHTMLSLCSNYTLNDIEVHFCVATKCAENDEEEKLKLYIYKAIMSSQHQELAQFLQNLLKSKEVDITLGELLKKEDIHPFLHNDIKKKNIKVHFVTTLTSKDARAEFSFIH